MNFVRLFFWFDFLVTYLGYLNQETYTKIIVENDFSQVLDILKIIVERIRY